MSLEQHAFIDRGQVPSRKRWQDAISKLGYALILDPDLEPFRSSGFVPCQLNAKPSGFEIFYEDVDGYSSAYAHLRERIAGKNYAISFRWGSDLAECACVLITSLALLDSFDAIIYYPETDRVYNRQELMNEIDECLKQI